MRNAEFKFFKNNFTVEVFLSKARFFVIYKDTLLGKSEISSLVDSLTVVLLKDQNLSESHFKNTMKNYILNLSFDSFIRRCESEKILLDKEETNLKISSPLGNPGRGGVGGLGGR